MGHRRGEFGSGRGAGDGDIELLRERVLDHADEEDAVSGNDIGDIDNSSSTGPIKVVVRQDGIGRTGATVIAVCAGLALGLAAMALVIMLFRDDSLRQEMRSTQVEYRVLLNHTMELEAKQKAMEEKR